VKHLPDKLDRSLLLLVAIEMRFDDRLIMIETGISRI
jgi:hypothetical protein